MVRWSAVTRSSMVNYANKWGGDFEYSRRPWGGSTKAEFDHTIEHNSKSLTIRRSPNIQGVWVRMQERGENVIEFPLTDDAILYLARALLHPLDEVLEEDE